MKLPEDFSKRMLLQLGPETFSKFKSSLEQTPPVSIRINPLKLNIQAELEKVPWCVNGYYLPSRPVFSSDPLWHAGAYYVQEASSMMLEQAFLTARQAIKNPVKVLDLCAAPGGKSSHIASMLDQHDVLVCNEVIKTRVPVLYENMVKQGYPNFIITNSDSSEFEHLGEIFDIILVDAPCSGEGLFRKDINAMDEWNLENVSTCEMRQKRILDAVKKCLKPEGYLIYSTCTYNPGENEQQLERLCSEGFMPVTFTLNGETNSRFQCYPHQIKGEGFYIALLQKQYTDHIECKEAGKNKLKVFKPDHTLKSLIDSAAEFYEFEEHILVVPEVLMSFYSAHISNLYCYAIGTKVGRIKDKNYYPSEYLPFSTLLERQAMPEIDLNQAQALSYLANNILPYQGREKGYALLTYMGVPLGLGKFAGNRINNLFPNSWRLRKQTVSSEWFTLVK